jgi:ATP-dependent helicase YprA (DUF1998 family)
LALEASDKTFTEDDTMGVRAAEQFLRIGAPFVIPCDRYDYQTLTNTKALPTAYFYETVPGGIGLAEKLLTIWPSVMEHGMEITETCTCKSGCPRCIHSNRYDKDAASVDKTHGLKFGTKLLAAGKRQPGEVYSHDVLGWEDHMP